VSIPPGANELAVQKAKTEITRLIKEELIRLVRYLLLGLNKSLLKTLLMDICFGFFYSKIPTSRPAKAGTRCCRGGAAAISPAPSKWLRNILVYIFNNVPFNYLSFVYICPPFSFLCASLEFKQTINTKLSDAAVTGGVTGPSLICICVFFSFFFSSFSFWVTCHARPHSLYEEVVRWKMFLLFRTIKLLLNK